jgi:hypothetical protein
MVIQQSPVKAKRQEIHVVVIRANGDREDRGMVAVSDKNPLRHWWDNLQVRRRAQRWQSKGSCLE